ncbi:hypothetical protein J3459_014264 [Metarhizium acridum]|uniref:uncharacterized protein n=1 Tax=Metarhizium acridum TaxID=92637 RepID=UPI001C6BDC13|nr:hypothetical protein J3459_014264 [Metarhizium acridum]KAG8416295.1 hypothetical protein J3458_006888 [Metarhizium acridum]
MTQATPEIHLIKSSRSDTYRDRVVQAYDDPPEAWQKALGENLSSEFGVFDQAEMTGPATIST